MRQASGVWQAAGIVAVGLVLSAGCASQKKAGTASCTASASHCPTPIVVWAEPVTEEMLQTPSSTYINNAGVQPAVSRRDWSASTTYHEPQVVRHGPLYFEDPFETVGPANMDCPDAWTAADFLAIPYSDGRWLLNTIALPVSMVVNPPWQGMCSDGEPSRQLLDGKVDATPCTQPVPEPFDLMCPGEQAAELAAAGGEKPVVVEANPAPATEPIP